MQVQSSERTGDSMENRKKFPYFLEHSESTHTCLHKVSYYSAKLKRLLAGYLETEFLLSFPLDRRQDSRGLGTRLVTDYTLSSIDHTIYHFMKFASGIWILTPHIIHFSMLHFKCLLLNDYDEMFV